MSRLMEATRRFLGRSGKTAASGASAGEKRSRSIPLNGTQAKGLAGVSAEGEGSESETGTGKPTAMMEAKPSRPMAMRSSSRQQAEVVAVLKKMHAQLEAQAEREKQLAAHVERIPESLAAGPQISRQITNIQEFLQDQAGAGRRRDESLQEAIANAAQQQKRQLDVLGLIEQQIESSNGLHGEVASSLDALRQSIVSGAEQAEKATERLGSIADSLERRETTMSERLLKAEQRLLIAAASAAVVSAGAMMLAAVAIFS